MVEDEVKIVIRNSNIFQEFQVMFLIKDKAETFGLNSIFLKISKLYIHFPKYNIKSTFLTDSESFNVTARKIKK